MVIHERETEQPEVAQEQIQTIHFERCKKKNDARYQKL